MTLKLRIVQDTDNESPRDWENLGTMVCWHTRSNLGDEQIDRDAYASGDQYRDQKIPNDAVVLPVYLYEHGGMALSTTPFSDLFDSGQVGWIYALADTIRETLNISKVSLPKPIIAAVIKDLKAEVSAYDDFLQGNVWGYVLEREITCEKCEHVTHEQIDSCFGFYGDDKDGIAEHLSDEVKPLLDEAWENRA